MVLVDGVHHQFPVDGIFHAEPSGTQVEMPLTDHLTGLELDSAADLDII